MKAFLKKYTSSIVTIAIAVTVGIAYGSLYLLGVTYNERVKTNQTILNGINQAEANQTLVMCQIFLGGQVRITDDDLRRIEKICKEKIKQAEKPISLSQPTPSKSGDARQPNVTSVIEKSTTSSTPVKNPAAKQDQDNTPPPPSLGDRVSGAVNGILNFIDPLK